jgi:hypothetical protein
MALKQEQNARAGDPLPFTISAVGKKDTIFFPSEIPEAKKDERLLTLGLLIEIAEIADLDITVTKRTVEQSVWNSIDALKDKILGAHYCLKREAISPIDNIPKEYKTGWEFIQWYAYSSAANDKSGGNYLKIPRVTSLFDVDNTAWTGNKQFSEILRITTLLRLAGCASSSKVGNPKSFLKGEGYFLEKYGGKKPIGGLYADDEIPFVTNHWNEKMSDIKEVYKNIPNRFQSLVGGIGSIIEEFNKPNPPTIKRIEAAKQNRISSLLTVTGRGRNQSKEISKGGSLQEKLININGGESVRTIGKVLWSPVFTGITQNQFVDLVMRNAYSMLDRDRDKTYYDAQLSKMANDGVPGTQLNNFAALSGAVAQATQVYLEIIPDHRGNPTWDSVFPNL